MSPNASWTQRFPKLHGNDKYADHSLAGIRRAETLKPGHFPKGHLYLAGFLGLGLCSIVVAKFNDESAVRFSTEAVLEAAQAEPVSASQQSAAEAALKALEPPTAAEEAAASVLPELRELTVEVAPGDSLYKLFNANQIPQRDLALLLDCEPLGPRLKNIYPGHTLTFRFAEDDTLMELRYLAGPLAEVEFERIGDRFSGREVTKEPERVATYRQGSIDHSLFVSSQRAGLNDGLTMRLAQLFQWDIDFVLDIRQGDSFHVLFEELYLGDRFIGHGDILAAEFINQGRSYLTVLFEDENGERGYYAPNGTSMRKAFLRAPVEFSRVSSNFNMRRKHPLYKRVMPHRGIDYAAPVGTPILASGDGRVVSATSNKNNGRYVVLQHGEQYVTKYLHLSRFARGIKAGSRVKQGQTIGYVGATGMVTGAHLHYEFLVNGVHRNPRTVPLPDAAPVPAPEREAFSSQSAERLALLASHKSGNGLELATSL